MEAIVHIVKGQNSQHSDKADKLVKNHLLRYALDECNNAQATEGDVTIDKLQKYLDVITVHFLPKDVQATEE
eukprot:8975278-Ditylum_brightwellii.AAC.1